ncbi:MAG: hypothetical protein KAT65_20025 [Methanophagales archaeon]|nr:hypothetical protein [Methanophagales archaeon]
MSRKTKFDIIFVLCWITSYIVSTMYLLPRGVAASDMAIWLSVITPIVLGVRSMIPLLISDYPILKPLLKNLADGRRYWLVLENEGGAGAKTSKVSWIYDKTLSSVFPIVLKYGGIVAPKNLSEDWRLPLDFPLPYNKKGESVIVRIETCGVDGKKDFCACRVFDSDGENWIEDIKKDHNTKPYLRKFKYCEDCMFRGNMKNMVP